MANSYHTPLNWHELRAEVMARKSAADRQVSRKRFEPGPALRTQDAAPFPDFTIAFQPIVDVATRKVFAQEALTRSPTGGSAASVFGSVSPRGILTFEALCREKAIRTAVACGLDTSISLNISPDALTLNGRGAADTIRFAEQLGLPADALILEVTENDIINDATAANGALVPLRQKGVRIALDDFGAGHSGLQVFVDVRPDIIKVDISLIRDLAGCKARQTVVRSIVECCEKLGVTVIAEGVETIAQARTLVSLGISLMQGFLFARPQIETLPKPDQSVLRQIASRM